MAAYNPWPGPARTGARHATRVAGLSVHAQAVLAGSCAGAGVSERAVLRRLDTTTATTMMATATSEIASRTPSEASGPTENCTIAGATSTDTRFITLMSGLMAGPAVSLNGSPTVSPITVAAW